MCSELGIFNVSFYIPVDVLQGYYSMFPPRFLPRYMPAINPSENSRPIPHVYLTCIEDRGIMAPFNT